MASSLIRHRSIPTSKDSFADDSLLLNQNVLSEAPRLSYTPHIQSQPPIRFGLHQRTDLETLSDYGINKDVYHCHWSCRNLPWHRSVAPNIPNGSLRRSLVIHST